MNQFLSAIVNSICSFVKDEEGAQVVEYALIIAVVSIGLVILLRLILGDGTTGAFNGFIARVQRCLGTTTCT